jgi:CSLREA domain-containing protein
VTRFDDPPPDGCNSKVDCSLREAIIAANEATPGDPETISLRPGVYQLSIPGYEDNARAGDLDITWNSGGVYIYGSSFGNVIIDRGGIDRVFDVCCQTNLLHIENGTIQNGALNWQQGFPFTPQDPATISCTTPTPSPGFYCHGHGAGSHNHGDLSLKNVTLRGSRVINAIPATPAWGGGLANGCGRYPSPGRQNCPLHANGDMTLTNVTISGNSVAGGKGGGIENNGVMSLNNVTIADNSAATSNGGGIFNNSAANPDAVVFMKNSIVANSPSGGNCAGTIASGGSNLSSDGTCGLTRPGDLPTNTNPGLDALADNGGGTFTHALRGDSPAIDAVLPESLSTTGCPPAYTDQRGISRPQQGKPTGPARCDIGAYEVAPQDLGIYAATTRLIRSGPGAS